MEDEFVAREKKILSLLEHEIEDGEEMAAAVRHMAERVLLGEKGYEPSDIRKNVAFDVMLGTEAAKSSLDYLVSLNGRDAMLVKCASGSLSSRERHAVAAARAFGGLPVPVAVVMDPMNAVVLDSLTGKVIGEGYDAIPAKETLVAMLSGKELPPLTPDRLEREKRILLAFDAIGCCIPRGADGGVQLGDTDEAGRAPR